MSRGAAEVDRPVQVAAPITPERLAIARKHRPNADGFCERCYSGPDGAWVRFPCLPSLLVAEVDRLADLLDALAETERLLGRIVGGDYGELCDHPDDCACTAAQAIRLLRGEP